MKYNYALIGNPNVGKTSLFNRLTRSAEHVGNWHGVTVAAKSKTVKHGEDEVTFVDLPGIYSLDIFSGEERISREAVLHDEYDAVFCVCESGNISRNLYLAIELIDRGLPVVVVVNMIDELTARGGKIDCELLSRRLGVPVVTSCAKRKGNLEPLYEAARKARKRPPRSIKSYDLQTVAARIYHRIDNAMQDVVTYSGHRAASRIIVRTLDKLTCGKYTALPIFLLVMSVIFWVVFGPLGSVLSNVVKLSVGFMSDIVSSILENSPTWLSSFAVDGIVGGIGSVLVFLPQIVLLYLCVGLMEDSGYLARVAFVFDGILRKMGLNGRAVITLLMGLGCSATAILTSRGLSDERMRRRSVMCAPYIPCSARIPTFALIAGAFFGGRPWLIVAMYVLGIAAAIFMCKIIGIFDAVNDETFILEMPPYRLPTTERVFQLVWNNVVNFLCRVGSTVVLLGIAVWGLTHFDIHGVFVTDGNLSIMHDLCIIIAPVFKPLGFGNWRAVSALIGGVFAKESIVTTLASLGGVQSIFIGEHAALCAVSFCVFSLLYIPCVATIAVMNKEIGIRWTLLAVVVEFAVAYVAAMVVYTYGLICINYGSILYVFMALFLIGLILLARKFLSQHRCRVCGRCGAGYNNEVQVQSRYR